MSGRVNLQVVLEDPHEIEGDEALAPTGPQLFVRLLAAPPGTPWDQARAAGLEARLGAPLPLVEVAYRLRRLEGWRPGAPGRYAAVYVRAREVGAGFATTVSVEGREIPVSFLSAAEQARRFRKVLVVAVAAGASVLLATGSVTLALARQAEAEARLQALEERAAAALKAAESQRRLKAQAVALDGADGRGRRLVDVLDDLAWASRKKAPTARLRAVHWDRGYMAFEVQGETPPFERPDRIVEKAPQPIRGDVWLWGVEPAGARAAEGGR